MAEEKEKSSQRRKNLLFGLTGSVACIKLGPILDILLKDDAYNIKIVLTEKAGYFIENENYFNEKKYKELGVSFFRDSDEWGSWKKKGDPVLHIELRKWADIFLIAPLSANTLAKLANGLSDNLLTCIFRAWDFSLKEGEEAKSGKSKLKKPIILAPAMNTFMFDVLNLFKTFLL